MAQNKKKKTPRLEDLIPDKEQCEEIKQRLYRGDPIVGEDGVFTDMLQAFVNASLEGEMDEHLENKSNISTGKKNRRNGYNNKQIKSRVGSFDIQTPRDRNGNYDPQMVKKWERELGSGMDDIILSLYARGQSVSDVQNQLRELYGVHVSAGTISSVTDRVWPEILEWQQRTLASCYPIVYLDAIHYKVREDGRVVHKAIYSVYGITADGKRDILGLYLNESEGSRQWGLILEDLKRRGVAEIFFFCVDGLTGFKEVIEEVYPKAHVQRCIVHMIRSSTRFVPYKDIKKVCSDLRKIYTAADRNQALTALESFAAKWDKKYPEIKRKWEASWDDLICFMDYGEHIRRIIYTTNPVEALHRIMRKVTKSKGAWSSDKALLKQLYMTLMHNQKSWHKKALNWKPIQRDLINQFGERYEKYL